MNGFNPIKIVNKFPSKHKILSEKFSQFGNFLPIASIDLGPFGVNEIIHIIFTFLDPENKELKFITKGDNVDVFGFEILPGGLYLPSFEPSSLRITSLFDSTFSSFLEKSELIRNSNIDLAKSIEYTEEPEWWQWDQTPLNSRGRKMKYFCHVELDDILKRWERLYIFFDSEDKIVKTIYQRT